MPPRRKSAASSTDERGTKGKATEGTRPSSGKRGTKRRTKVEKVFADTCLQQKWNVFYEENVVKGMWVECEKCLKWRLLKEYREAYEVPEYFDCSMWSLDDGERGNCDIPQTKTVEQLTSEKYTPGSLVWAKMKGFPEWPAMVEDEPQPVRSYYVKDLGTRRERYHVVFFGKEVSRKWIYDEGLRPFKTPPSDKMPKRIDLRKAVEDAMDACNMDKEERWKEYGFDCRTKEQNKNIKEMDEKSASKDDEDAPTDDEETEQNEENNEQNYEEDMEANCDKETEKNGGEALEEYNSEEPNVNGRNMAVAVSLRLYEEYIMQYHPDIYAEHVALFGYRY